MEHITEEPLVAGPRPDPVQQKRARRSTRALWLAAAVGTVAALAALSWWYLYDAQRPEASALPHPVVSTAPASAVKPPMGDASPAIRHPIEKTQPVPPTSLPGLDQSDARLTQALAELLGQRWVPSKFRTDGFVRRFVATVDGLPRQHAASRLWPVNPAPARFLVARNADHEFIDADNGLRYTPLVLLVEHLDVNRAASIYATLYPLFQQAYEDLGYPDKYFNDRLVEVIDHLLAAPEPTDPVAVRLVEVRGPMRMTRPWVHYEFIAPELEALSAGQKLMVRVGPVNETRLKARLRAIRAAVAEAPASR